MPKISEEALMQELTTRGFAPHVAAGIAGNLLHESAGGNTDINEAKPTVAGSRGGFGLAQWTGPRRKALEQFAAETKRPVGDPGLQLDYLQRELDNDPGTMQALNATNDPRSAALVFSNKFERPNPAMAHNDRRMSLAERAMNFVMPTAQAGDIDSWLDEKPASAAPQQAASQDVDSWLDEKPSVSPTSNNQLSVSQGAIGETRQEEPGLLQRAGDYIKSQFSGEGLERMKRATADIQTPEYAQKAINTAATGLAPVNAAMGIGRQMLAGGATSAGLTDGSIEDKAKAGLEGALIAGGLGGAGKLISAVGSKLSSGVTPDAQKAINAGYKLTGGQAAGPGSWLNALETSAESAPLVGSSVRAARQGLEDQLNQRAFKQVADKVGAADVGTGEAAFAKIQDKVNELYTAAKDGIKIPERGVNGLKFVLQHGSQELSDDGNKLISRLAQPWLQRAAKTGTMDGEQALSMRSSLREAINDLQSGSANDRLDAKIMRDTILPKVTKVIEAHGSQDAIDAVRKADSAYGSLLQLEKAGASQMGTEGFTANQLARAGRETARQKVSGRANDITQEARLISRVNQKPFGNSGTTDRLLNMMPGLKPLISGAVGLASTSGLGSKLLTGQYNLTGKASGALQKSITPTLYSIYGDK